ncbi:hypothetical protein SAMN04490220_7106 [Rhodococcus jostii]|uniref:Uncharacterized protein n=1 Tax=Rhodococcus jostii TaxID=132919 RepID=A0A1H5H833_RHOJO|nr:hypothetical protein SAMN04490220_7106 [Rhodococcus jostii]
MARRHRMDHHFGSSQPDHAGDIVNWARPLAASREVTEYLSLDSLVVSLDSLGIINEAHCGAGSGCATVKGSRGQKGARPRDHTITNSSLTCGRKLLPAGAAQAPSTPPVSAPAPLRDVEDRHEPVLVGHAVLAGSERPEASDIEVGGLVPGRPHRVGTAARGEHAVRAQCHECPHGVPAPRRPTRARCHGGTREGLPDRADVGLRAKDSARCTHRRSA